MTNSLLMPQPVASKMIEAFGIGYWQLQLADGSLFWSENTRKIHDVGPEFQPELAAAINFYSKQEPGQKAIAEVIERAIEHQQPWDIECRLVTAKGRQIWARSTGEVIVDEVGTVVAIHGFIQDVSAYMNALEASQLYKQDLEYQQYALDRHAIVSMADTHGQILYANDKFVEVSGYALTELLGNNHHILNSGVHGPAFWQSFWQRISAGESIRVEICNRSKQGELYWVDSSVVPHFDKNGEIDRYISIRTDITERKQQEEKQRELERALQQAQKMEVVGQMVGGIAHDFNNILAVVVGYGELLQRMVHKQERPTEQKYIDQVVSSSHRAKDLVARLLSFSRGSDEQNELISIAKAVDDFQEFIRPVLPSSIELAIDIEDDSLEVLFNYTSLSQILMNLAVNARDAMSSGGCLKLMAKMVTLDGGAHCSSCFSRFFGRCVLIEVSDTGTGIDPLIVRKLFEPFFSTKDVGKGSGVGLSMVHGLVHGADGHIIVESSERGSILGVYLPIMETYQTPELAGIEDEKPVLTGFQGDKTIFIVDDEPDIARMLGGCLQDSGLIVELYSSAEHLLDDLLLKNKHCDLLVTDITMPVFTGSDIAIMVQQTGRKLPVVAMSGYNESVNEYNYQKAGFAAYLDKPISPADFTEVVQRLLGV